MTTVIVPVDRYLEGTRESWGPRHVGGYYKSKYPDLRYCMPLPLHGNFRWFMVVEVVGDPGQLTSLLAEPDVWELALDARPVAGGKRTSIVAMATEAGLTLAKTATNREVLESLHAEEDKKRSGGRQMPKSEEDALKVARPVKDMN